MYYLLYKCLNNEIEAKHCAALLALHYFQPNIPHENKLPEPYIVLYI